MPPRNCATWCASIPSAVPLLRDEGLSINFAEHAAPDDRVAVVVTAPWTRDEQWTPLLARELKVCVDGAPLALQAKACSSASTNMAATSKPVWSLIS